jgi:hypothetical protein
MSTSTKVGIITGSGFIEGVEGRHTKLILGAIRGIGISERDLVKAFIVRTIRADSAVF